jgi:hypothetical protein
MAYVWGFIIVVLFMGAALVLYKLNFGVPVTVYSAYLIKTADAFINGALVTVLVGMVRVLFGVPRFW